MQNFCVVSKEAQRMQTNVRFNFCVEQLLTDWLKHQSLVS